MPPGFRSGRLCSTAARVIATMLAWAFALGPRVSARKRELPANARWATVTSE